MEDITGQKFGRLTAIRVVKKIGIKYYWLFKCDCGNEKVIIKANVKNGTTKSCGCFNKEKTGNLNKTHCLTKTVEYNTWTHIKQRCYNKFNKNYNSYGGRGITVCNRWLNSFENFLEDMGKRPLGGYSLDRIDNNKEYSYENCRWATPTQQNRNSRKNKIIKYNSEKKCLAQWCEDLKLNYKKTLRKLNSGYTVNKVFTNKEFSKVNYGV